MRQISVLPSIRCHRLISMEKTMKYHHIVRILVVAIIVMAAGECARADDIWLQNGDHMTGTVVKRIWT